MTWLTLELDFGKQLSISDKFLPWLSRGSGDGPGASAAVLIAAANQYNARPLSARRRPMAGAGNTGA